MIDFNSVKISEGFWKNRQEINEKTTIYSIYDRFKETGRFESLKLKRKDSHIFWDSDIAKWIEAASYIIQNNRDKKLIKLCDELIDLIKNAQQEDGYFNIYYQTCDPQSRFTRRTDHELYCLGHLIEAAVAYSKATSKNVLLNVVCKYIDLIEKVFVNEKSAAFTTPGHEEIELALVKIYNYTGEERYLKLGQFFVDMRGQNDENEYDFAFHSYSQSHLPVREQFTAEGHSVRACYLYTAMADLAYIKKDNELKNACEKIFEDIANRKMYITGGIGSTYNGEAFSIDYDLPNDIAYAESCAAIALIYFANRMLKIETNSKYSDVIERVLYNGFLSSISLNGKAFFYKNPLEINLGYKDRFPSTKDSGHFPETQRLEVFDCSCCPPNISRLLATIGDYIYSEDNNILYIHQYISSELNHVKLVSNFPNDGNILVSGHGYKTIAIRKPFWSDKFNINANYTENNGYLYIDVNCNFNIEIDFIMETKLMESNIKVIQNIGKLAVMRGPIVYCCESENVHNIFLSEDYNPQCEFSTEYNTNILNVKGYSKSNSEDLYSQKSENYIPTNITLIPYFGFANHGESNMIVWFNKK